MPGDTSDVPDEQSGDSTGRTALPTDADADAVPTDDPSWGPEPARTWSRGERQPAPPTAAETAALLAAVDPDGLGDTVACVRVVLATENPDIRTRLLERLRSEQTVLGTSADGAAGPAQQAVFDALLAPEHDPFGVVSALASVDPVAGVAMAKYPLAAGDTAAGGGAPAEGGADESAATTGATEESAAAGGDGDELVESVVDSPEALFDELRAELDPIEYEDLVEELEAADVRTADGTEVDIDHLLPAADDDADDGADHGARDTPAPGAFDGGERAGEEADETAPGEDRPAAGADGEAVAAAGQPAGDNSTAGGGSAGDLDPDAVLSAMVTALQESELREPELTAFRDALGISAPESMRARLSHLQMQVDELLAYRRELESFIDATDGGQRVTDLEQEVTSLSSTVETVDERTDDLQSDLESVAGALAGLDDRVDAAADKLEALDATVTDLESDLQALDEEAARASDLQALDEEAARESDLEALDAAAARESTVATLDDRVDDLRAELAAIDDWRDRLETALVPDEDDAGAHGVDADSDSDADSNSDPDADAAGDASDAGDRRAGDGDGDGGAASDGDDSGSDATAASDGEPDPTHGTDHDDGVGDSQDSGGESADGEGTAADQAAEPPDDHDDGG